SEPVSAAPKAAGSSRSIRRWGHKPRRAARIAAAAAMVAVVFFGGLALGRAWPTAPALPQMAGGASSDPQNGAASHKEGRMVVHLLGFVNMRGEDGARQAVPILAAPGLKVDASPLPGTTLAAQEPKAGSATLPGAHDEPVTFSLSPQRRVVIP